MSNVFNEEYLINCMRGAIAERVFELLHRELYCKVYKTGHEILYPDLLDSINIRKKKKLRNISEEEIVEEAIKFEKLQREESLRLNTNLPIDFADVKEEELTDSMKSFAKDSLIFHITHRSHLSNLIASNPDFTIVYPDGNIRQFEIKFRSYGELEEKQRNKYLKYHNSSYIFLVTSKSPYIKLLVPKKSEDTQKKQSEQMDAFIKKYRNRTDRPDKNLLLPNDMYEEILEDSIYTKEILQRYRLVVKSFFEKK